MRATPAGPDSGTANVTPGDQQDDNEDRQRRSRTKITARPSPRPESGHRPPTSVLSIRERAEPIDLGLSARRLPALGSSPAAVGRTWEMHRAVVGDPRTIPSGINRSMIWPALWADRGREIPDPGRRTALHRSRRLPSLICTPPCRRAYGLRAAISQHGRKLLPLQRIGRCALAIRRLRPGTNRPGSAADFSDRIAVSVCFLKKDHPCKHDTETDPCERGRRALESMPSEGLLADLYTPQIAGHGRRVTPPRASRVHAHASRSTMRICLIDPRRRPSRRAATLTRAVFEFRLRRGDARVEGRGCPVPGRMSVHRWWRDRRSRPGKGRLVERDPELSMNDWRWPPGGRCSSPTVAGSRPKIRGLRGIRPLQ